MTANAGNKEMKMKRREFIRLSSLTAGAALAGCAVKRGSVFVPDEKAFVSGALIHLGSNMWTDVYTSAKPRKKGWDDKVAADYVRAHDEVWHEVTDAMAKAKMNMIVIDLGEAVEYPSHPELKVKGTWSVAKLRRELDRLRAMGIEPIPKVNFSTTHNAWMKDWRYKVSSPEYMQTVKDIIYDVAEMFDRPRFIHIGYDEETMGHQGGWGNYQYIVVRKRELWWKDFLFTVQCVRDTGARAWCFSDQAWYEPDLFEKLMPKDVVQCPWNCVKSEKHPEWTTSIDKIGEMGFDVIADCATYPGSHVKPDPSGLKHTYTPIDRAKPNTQVKVMSAYCKEKIAPEHLKGFIVCPWVLTVPGIPREVLLDSIDYAGAEFAAFAAGSGKGRS
jgi:hypothetical protein